jgi:hypothetical protein
MFRVASVRSFNIISDFKDFSCDEIKQADPGPVILKSPALWDDEESPPSEANP